MLLGRMMHQPLSVGSLIDHAARYHADTEIVSALTEGGFERTTWGEVAEGDLVNLEIDTLARYVARLAGGL